MVIDGRGCLASSHIWVIIYILLMKPCMMGKGGEGRMVSSRFCQVNPTGFVLNSAWVHDLLLTPHSGYYTWKSG